jgi:hypothetical protein
MRYRGLGGDFTTHESWCTKDQCDNKQYGRTTLQLDAVARLELRMTRSLAIGLAFVTLPLNQR